MAAVETEVDALEEAALNVVDLNQRIALLRQERDYQQSLIRARIDGEGKISGKYSYRTGRVEIKNYPEAALIKVGKSRFAIRRLRRLSISAVKA